jgi:uncharacterized membrane protein
MKQPISASQLRDELVRRRLLGASSTAALPPPVGRPWFISILLGTSAWLASLFALGFIWMLFTPRTAGAYAVCGLILLAATFGLYAADRAGAFFGQLALTLSIAGQLAMVFAAHEATHSATITAVFTAALQLLLLFVMPNRLAKLIAAFFACCAWAMVVRLGWWGEKGFITMQDVAPGQALIGWFVVWLPVVAAVHALLMNEHRWMASGLQQTARAALTGLLLGLATATWLSAPLSTLVLWGDQPRSNWLVLWPLLGVLAALIAAIYAFRLRHRALIGVAILGALQYVGQFYYLLGTTLLIKSCIMLAIGVLALLAAFALKRQSSLPEAAS